MTDKSIDDIVNMIDSFMQGDGGHLNVSVDANGEVNTDSVNIDKTISTDCAAGNLSCKVPTLFEGMDRDDNE